MKKILLLTLLIVGSLLEGSEVDKKSQHNISIGMLDDKIGLSLIGYTYDVKLSEKKYFYLGGGTSLLVNTLSSGLKYYYIKSKFSIYSVFSLKRMYMGYIQEYTGSELIDTITASFSLEYNLSNKTHINLGAVGVLDDAEGSYEFWGYPFMGLNFRF